MTNFSSSDENINNFNSACKSRVYENIRIHKKTNLFLWKKGLKTLHFNNKDISVYILQI